jgi:hypothetical protein
LQTITDNKGAAPKTITGTPADTWSANHLTKTTTYSFADGTQNPILTTVLPTQQGLTHTSSSYPSNWTSTAGSVTKPSVTPLTNLYGDSTTITLEAGTTSLPFNQSTLSALNITDPNAIVKAPSSTIYDLTWGTPDKNGPLISSESNVNAQINLTSININILSKYYGGSSINLPISYSQSVPLGIPSSSLQGVWLNNDVKSAWNQGWTGANIKIGIMDDFTVNNYSDTIQVPFSSGLYFSKNCNNLNGVIFCSADSRLIIRMTHGDQVSMIAGGNLNALLGIINETGAYGSSNDLGLY